MAILDAPKAGLLLEVHYGKSSEFIVEFSCKV